MGRRVHVQEGVQAGGNVGRRMHGQEGMQAGGIVGRRMHRQEDAGAGGNAGRRMHRQEGLWAGGGTGRRECWPKRCTGRREHRSRQRRGRQEKAAMGAAAPSTHLLLRAGDRGEVGVRGAAGGLRVAPGLPLPREVVDLPLVVPPAQGQSLQPPPWGLGSRGDGVTAAGARAAQGWVSQT